jgi:hypothetical protein
MQRQTISKVHRRSSRNNHLKKQSTKKPAAKRPMVALQQSIGNRAIQRLIRSRYIQAKLQVGAPNDLYEQEADRVAERVMRMPDSQVSSGVTISNQMQISRLQRECMECEKEKEVQRQPLEQEEKPLEKQPGEEEETLQPKTNGMQTSVIQRLCSECEKEEVQRQPLEQEEKPLEKQPGEEEERMLQGKTEGGNGPQVSGGTQSQIESLKGGGQPLPQSVRAHFEPRFGHDFSGVRVHTGAQAAQVARSINAQAFTVGSDMAFAAGQYSPETSKGQRLLAHELTHVVQQGGASPQSSSKNGKAGNAAQREVAPSRTPTYVARQPTGPPPPGGRAHPSWVSLIRVSCDSDSIEFRTDAGVYTYELTDCDIGNVDYLATVTVQRGRVTFSPPPGGGRFEYRARGSQLKPSTFFRGQSTVRIVAGTSSPAPGPTTTTLYPYKVCSRQLQVSRWGNHGYIEAPSFRYAIISPLCPQHWYDNPIWPGTGGQKWDNSPDPCGKPPTCLPCLPKPGVTDVGRCLRDAFTAYNNPSLFRVTGPNSNTFTGTLARACCAFMDPKPNALGWMPGWYRSPAPPRTGGRPCPPGPRC